MSEILPGVHQIPVNYKGRPLKLYLLRGTEACMLLDTGEATTPQTDVIPYLKSIGLTPDQLTYILITHPDVDHQGGMAAMKAWAPKARFICGSVDRVQVENPVGCLDLRYGAFLADHQIGPKPEDRPKMLARLGHFTPVDWTFSGGEVLRLGENHDVEVLHLPGHAQGLLGIYLPQYHAALIDDAVHGQGNYFLDGRLAFAPTYMEVGPYLQTIERLQAMKLTNLFSCHWPDLHDCEAVSAWLAESKAYCLRAEELFARLLAEHPAGLTLKEIIPLAKPSLGDWPAERDSDTRSMAVGHLEHLVAKGRARVISYTPPRRYGPAK